MYVILAKILDLKYFLYKQIYNLIYFELLLLKL
jgi:hypothetical protein